MSVSNRNQLSYLVNDDVVDVHRVVRSMRTGIVQSDVQSSSHWPLLYNYQVSRIVHDLIESMVFRF